MTCDELKKLLSKVNIEGIKSLSDKEIMDLLENCCKTHNTLCDCGDNLEVIYTTHRGVFMNLENLTRYMLVSSPAGYSDFIRQCNNGECGEYVKFEDVVELLKQADNSKSTPLPACITCAVPNCGMKAGYCGMYKPQ
jgi:hypothetical protein